MLLLLPAIAVALSPLAAAFGGIVAFFTFITSMLYLFRFIKATGIRAELDAKDEVIKTNQQTIKALGERLHTMDKDNEETIRRLTAAEDLINDLKIKLDEQAAQYEVLKQYSAPEAIDAVRELLVAQYSNMVSVYSTNTERLIASIERLEGSLS
jgi:septal ring factor EnvC (AmiA/AmiB activator)